jgi:hypothetical protein
LKYNTEELTPFALAMPDEYRDQNDVVKSYRKYYLAEKIKFAKWRESTPMWWTM